MQRLPGGYQSRRATKLDLPLAKLGPPVLSLVAKTNTNVAFKDGTKAKAGSKERRPEERQAENPARGLG